MTHILLVTKEDSEFGVFGAQLEKDKKNVIYRTGSGSGAMAIICKEKFDVIVAAEKLSDCDGLTFIKEIAKTMPLINCAIVSPLPYDEFHEKTEGLGVFMQLPVNPGAEEATKMMRLLESINVLLAF